MLRSRLTLLAGAMLFAVAVPAAAQQKPVAKAPKKGAVKAVVEREANPAGPFARLTSIQRDSIIQHTRSLLGVRYKWAGLNPAKGLDCSGIVKYVFAKLGVELPHRAAELAKMGDPITKDTAAMQPGDLLVFVKYRPAGGLQWKGVRRIVALDSTVNENDPEPLPAAR